MVNNVKVLKFVSGEEVIARIEQEIVLIRWLRVVRVTQLMILTCDSLVTLLLVQSPSKHL